MTGSTGLSRTSWASTRSRSRSKPRSSTDLGADSLDLVELIMAFEDEFKDEVKELEISDEEAEGLATVQAAIDFLVSKGVPKD